MTAVLNLVIVGGLLVVIIPIYVITGIDIFLIFFCLMLIPVPFLLPIPRLVRVGASRYIVFGDDIDVGMFGERTYRGDPKFRDFKRLLIFCYFGGPLAFATILAWDEIREDPLPVIAYFIVLTLSVLCLKFYTVRKERQDAVRKERQARLREKEKEKLFEERLPRRNPNELYFNPDDPDP